jgi:hypothetical protein
MVTEHSEYDSDPSGRAEPREPYLKLAVASMAGPLCWVLHFALVYLLEGLFCIKASPPLQLITGTIVAATLVFGAACVWLIIRSGHWLRKMAGARLSSLEFLVYVTRMLAGLALLAIVWVGTGSAFLHPCSAVY